MVAELVLRQFVQAEWKVHFPVRYVLTIVAVALVAVMSVALVAPLLIDWSAQRGETRGAA